MPEGDKGIPDPARIFTSDEDAHLSTMPTPLSLVERKRRSAPRWSGSRLPLSRSIREIPENFPDRVAEAVRVMVMRPVFRGSPWLPLVPAVTRERSSERPPRGRSAEARLVESAVDRERASL